MQCQKFRLHFLSVPYFQAFVCGDKSWQPNTFPGAILVGVRVVVTLLAGICMDMFGRRRSVVAWMGLYFVVAFARAFSPNEESVVFCVTIEGAAAQAATLALILLGKFFYFLFYSFLK